MDCMLVMKSSLDRALDGVCHMQVALHGGAPNKNIGDAFLLVWKFPKGCTEEDIARAATSLTAKVKAYAAAVCYFC